MTRSGKHSCVTALLLLLLASTSVSASDLRKAASASLSVDPRGGLVTWKKNGTFPMPYGLSVTTPNATAVYGPSRAALSELKAAIDAYAAVLASDAAALEAAKINHDAKAGIRLALATHASGFAAAKARAKAAVAAALANAVPGASCPNGTVAVPVELGKVLAAKAPEVTLSVVVGSNKTSLLARAAAGLASAKALLLNATAAKSAASLFNNPSAPGRRRRSLSVQEGAEVVERAVEEANSDAASVAAEEAVADAAAEAALVDDEEDFAAFRMSSSDDPEGLLEDVASAYASSLLSVGKSSSSPKNSSVDRKFWDALTTIAPNAQADAASSGAICVVPQCLLPGGALSAAVSAVATAAGKEPGCSCVAGYGTVSPWDLKAVAWAEALAAFTAASGKNLSSVKTGLLAGKNKTAAVARLQQKQSLWGLQPGSLLPGFPFPWAAINSSLWKWKTNGTSAVKVARLPAIDVEVKKLVAASLASNVTAAAKEAAAGLLATTKPCGKCPPGWASTGGVGSRCVKCPGGSTCNACAPGTGFSLDTGFCEPTGLFPTCPSCTCDPRTCSAAKAQCGAAPNGCSGSTPDCGTCSGTLSCDLGSNLCSCPVGQSPPPNATSTTLATTCFTDTGGSCAQGSTCGSGRCAASSCVSSCPSGSSPAPSTGACQCDATFYGGAGGGAPCTACGSGSTSTAGSSTACSCPASSVWSASNNACTCPNTLQSFVTGNCLGSPTAACSAGKQCLSAECSSSVGGQCVSSCPPNSSDLSSSGLCSCNPGNPGYFSSTGQPGCVKCGTGSTSSAYGSTSCSCSTPTGSVWNAATNSCACPAGKTNVNGACLVVNGGPCAIFTQCASGICDVGQCVAQCPTGSVLNGGTSNCECTSGYYNPSSGSTPCTACGGGSTSTGTLTTFCTCSGTGTWNSATNSCACLAGKTYVAAAATCLNDLGQTCATAANCVSGVCSGFVCSSTCAPNSSDRAGFCRCNPGYFDLLNGVPPCTACPAGSSSSIQGYGSQGCVCQSPTGSVWDSATNSCLCPAGKQLVGGACLSSNGQSCSAGTRCASGLCSSSQCVASCPAGSTNNGGGGCTCDPGYFNPFDGQTPCVACGGGSTSSGIAQQVCTCPVGSGATWSAATNTCVCTDPNRGFVSSSGTCLLKNNQACALGTDCASGTCSSGVCVAACPASSARDANGNCMCTANTFSNTIGQPPCTACPAGASSGVGATSCSCPAPFAWDPLTDTCSCPSGTTLVGGQCLSVPGQLCSSGSQCASGLCANDSPTTGIDANVCVTSCQSPQSTATASGSCQCAAGAYGPGGFSPCVLCGSSSTSVTAGASACSCPLGSGATWSKVLNACVCDPGSVLVRGQCVKNDGGTCAAGSQCLSGECSSGVCVSACPQGSTDSAGFCLCNPNFFSLTGQAPGCTACPPGSASTLAGRDSCGCTQPTGSAWDTASSTCQCPAGTQLTPAGSTGACLLSAGQPCQGGADCSSGLCAATNSTGPLTCVASCPAGSVADGGGGCSCALGFSSSTGAAPCVACGGGSTTTSVGASSCTCPASTSGWDAAANACLCPPGQGFSASDGACLNVNSRPCATGADCVSNECSTPLNGVCASSCSSFPDASNYAPKQTCECNQNAYGPGGGPPCTLCVAGSTAPQGSTSCSCSSPSGSTWDAATNTCVCPTGTQAVSGACLSGNGQACTSGTTCASGLCDGGVCAAACAVGTASGGLCICPAGQIKCSGSCVDVNTNLDNCGGCGSVCKRKFILSTGNQCVKGICTVTGKLTFTLTWNNDADLAFSILPPVSGTCQRPLYYVSNTNRETVSLDCKGAVDAQLTVLGRLQAIPLGGPQVIYFNPAATGSYNFCVNPTYRGPANYTITVKQNGAIVQVLTGTVAAATAANRPIDPNGSQELPCDPLQPFPGASTGTYVV